MKRRLNLNTKVSYTRKEINQMKSRAYAEGQQDTLNIVNLFPLLVLRDKFGFGKKRIERYIKHYLNTIEAYNEDYIGFEDIVEVMQEEVKMDLEDFIS